MNFFLVSLIVVVNSSRPRVGNDQIFGNHDDDDHYSGGFTKQREPFGYENCFRTELHKSATIHNEGSDRSALSFTIKSCTVHWSLQCS